MLAVAEATDTEVFVGNSLGGAICMHLLLERSIDPQGPVLAGTDAKLGVISSLRGWLENDFERAIEFLHEPGKLFVGGDAVLDEEVLERSKATMQETERAVTQHDFLTCIRFDIIDRLGEIAVPTLVICGERDRLTPPEYHEHLAEHVPNADLVTLPEVAHPAMIERPDAFAGTVEEFVADLDR